MKLLYYKVCEHYTVCLYIAFESDLSVHVGIMRIINSKGQTNDYKIGIYCFSANHAALRRKTKDWLGRNQNNVSE